MHTRRTFLGQASLGFAALTLGARSRAGEEPGAKKLGIVLAGLGGYATGQLAPALQQTKQCRLVGVVTGSPEKGRAWAQKYGFPEKNIYSYDTMGRMADNKDIDIVYVVTPNALHKEHTLAAAKAGKHVISEKPMANSVADCDAMIAACRAQKVKLSIGYRLQFEPHYDELKRLARDKDFGAFKAMGGGLGFSMTQPQWRAQKKLAGGGPLMDLGIYCIQAACMAGGIGFTGQIPMTITAWERPKQRPEFFRDVEETIDVRMEFGGVKMEFVTSYNGGIDQFRAEADKGWIEFKPAFQYGGLNVKTSRGPLNLPVPPTQQAGQMDAFAACVRDNQPSTVPGEMGRRDMVIIEAIYASAAQGGKTIEIKV